ncbi:hypothetical protein [Georgenia yuyongxinii]
MSTTTTTTTTATLLTLPGVAALARVQRPVVSMWRRRSAGTDLPFPSSTVRDGEQELFDVEDVTRWLIATGRGNNSAVAQESALFVSLRAPEPYLEGAMLPGVTALLALEGLGGERLTDLSVQDLLDLADDVDPHDAVLYRELEALGEHLPSLAAHVDAMTDAAYTPAAAFESLMAGRFRLGLTAQCTTALTSEVTGLVARLAQEMSRDAWAATLVDASGGSDLLVEIRRRLAEDLDPPAAVHPGTGRLDRCRLAAHGWRVGEAALDQDGRIVLDGRSVVIAQYPSAARPDLSDLDVLTAVDDIALAMSGDDRAVVVGPASALADATRDRAVEQVRSGLLRTDRVRAVLRLPAGLRTTQPRQRLALWVLGPAHPAVAIADRWVAVADVRTGLDEATTQDLLTDVLAALGTRSEVHAHAFRFARLARTSALIAAVGDLVGPLPDRATAPPTTPAALAIRVEELAAAVSATGTEPLDVHVTTREPRGAATVTLGALVATGRARVVAGNRIDPADLETAGAVPVLGTDELLGERAVGDRAAERLAFSARYPAGRFTDPGDIVFCTTPGIGARVDEAGLAVVPAPARVLRLDRAAEPRLVPAVVAAAMRAATGPEWRSWTVPLVPEDQVASLEPALGAVAATRMDLERRLAALDELATVLTEATTSGALTLHTTDAPEQEG